MDILIKMQIPRVPALAKWERKGERERERAGTRHKSCYTSTYKS
jgi:hypothetical protein